MMKIVRGRVRQMAQARRKVMLVAANRGPTQAPNVFNVVVALNSGADGSAKTVSARQTVRVDPGGSVSTEETQSR